MPNDQESQERFEQCVHACADSLYRVAYRLTGNRTLASELVQETYLNAWKGLDSLSDPDRMRSWMFSILRNQYSKLIRKESKVPSSYESLESVSSATEVASNETNDIVQASIQKLDDKHKLPLLLVSMEGMSVDDAAIVLSVPRGTVLSRLHRARQKLRSILEPQLPPKVFTEGNHGS